MAEIGSFELEVIERKKRTLNWSEKEVNALINIWRNNLRDLRGQKRNSHVYRKIAAELRELGIHRRVDDVKTKIKNLQREYRKERRKLKHGDSSTTWKFWDAVHAIIGYLPPLLPPSQLLQPPQLLQPSQLLQEENILVPDLSAVKQEDIPQDSPVITCLMSFHEDTVAESSASVPETSTVEDDANSRMLPIPDVAAKNTVTPHTMTRGIQCNRGDLKKANPLASAKLKKVNPLVSARLKKAEALQRLADARVQRNAILEKRNEIEEKKVLVLQEIAKALLK